MASVPETTESHHEISHDQALEAAKRLTAGAFRRDGERLPDDERPRFSIPTRPDRDDDVVLVDYIAQQRAKAEAAADAPRDMGTDGDRLAYLEDVAAGMEADGRSIVAAVLREQLADYRRLELEIGRAAARIDRDESEILQLRSLVPAPALAWQRPGVCLVASCGEEGQGRAVVQPLPTGAAAWSLDMLPGDREPMIYGSAPSIDEAQRQVERQVAAWPTVIAGAIRVPANRP